MPTVVHQVSGLLPTPARALQELQEGQEWQEVQEGLEDTIILLARQKTMPACVCMCLVLRVFGVFHVFGLVSSLTSALLSSGHVVA